VEGETALPQARRMPRVPGHQHAPRGTGPPDVQRRVPGRAPPARLSAEHGHPHAPGAERQDGGCALSSPAGGAGGAPLPHPVAQAPRGRPRAAAGLTNERCACALC
jgi:hypothetical protein